MTTQKAAINLKNPNARVVDQAFPPAEDDPSSPNVVMNLAGGFFGGLAFGAALVFAVAFLDDRVKSAFDVEGAIGLPMLMSCLVSRSLMRILKRRQWHQTLTVMLPRLSGRFILR